MNPASLVWSTSCISASWRCARSFESHSSNAVLNPSRSSCHCSPSPIAAASSASSPDRASISKRSSESVKRSRLKQTSSRLIASKASPSAVHLLNSKRLWRRLARACASPRSAQKKLASLSRVIGMAGCAASNAMIPRALRPRGVRSWPSALSRSANRPQFRNVNRWAAGVASIPGCPCSTAAMPIIPTIGTEALLPSGSVLLAIRYISVRSKYLHTHRDLYRRRWHRNNIVVCSADRCVRHREAPDAPVWQPMVYRVARLSRRHTNGAGAACSQYRRSAKSGHHDLDVI